MFYWSADNDHCSAGDSNGYKLLLVKKVEMIEEQEAISG